MWGNDTQRDLASARLREHERFDLRERRERARRFNLIPLGIPGGIAPGLIRASKIPGAIHITGPENSLSLTESVHFFRAENPGRSPERARQSRIPMR